MKTKKIFFLNLILICFLFPFSNIQAQETMPKWVVEMGNQRAENMAKDLGLTPEQQKFIANEMAIRYHNNSQMAKDLTTLEEKKAVYQSNNEVYFKNIAAFFPKDLVVKIKKWEMDDWKKKQNAK